jgi:hypothetical protein
MTSNKLPPWGILDAGYLADIKIQPIPPDWKTIHGKVPKLRDWNRWRGRIVRDLARMLWPTYEHGKSKWSTKSVDALNDADFNLLTDLRLRFPMPISAAFPTTVTHAILFAEEDGAIGLGSHYERYDPQLQAQFTAQMPTLLLTGLRKKVGTLALQIKQVIQRPRAYQVAFIEGRSGFSHEPAQSADTPSMVSGHCLQGALGGCSAYAELAQHLNPSSVKLLEQLTVDIGDRRVFAGVHYPSDSLASWFVALKLVPHVFPKRRQAAITDFLGDAISSKSAVFAAIRDHVVLERKSPYKQALRAVENMVARRQGPVRSAPKVHGSSSALRRHGRK